MYAQRTLENFIRQAGQQFPVLLVTGPRQVGKTTLLRHLADSERTYVTLDDPTLAVLAREEPALFLERFRPPVLIDEIQYAPELLPHIKMHVDRNHQPSLFWLTGSQPFHLMRGVSESLAGRVGIINLLGLSLSEIQGNAADHAPFAPLPEKLESRSATRPVLDLGALYTTIWRGAFPAIALNRDMDRDLFYSSYVQTYLQRDVRDLTNVGNATSFVKFLRAAAARTGQLINLSDMARDTNISPNTAKSWLSILETSGIVYLLEPYHNNVTKRLVKAPKLYFLDTGLCAYLTEWSTPETLEAGALSGAILETWVVTEILKSWWNNGKRPSLYFYRDRDKKEIDLLIDLDDTLYPLEIKKTASPRKDAVRHFGVLNRLNRTIGPGGLLCMVKTVLPITGDVNAIPVWII